MSNRPLPPLRRSGPTVPPRNDTGNEEIESEKPVGIAARIANLKLEQKGLTPGTGRHPLAKPPPPRKLSTTKDAAVPPIKRGAHCPSYEELSARGADFLRLINRVPPPPPPRHLPAVPASLPTPPPEPEPEPEYYDSVAAPISDADSCLKCHDFSYVDYHASQFPRHSVQSLDTLAHDLTSPFSSETEKCRALFTWMHHNIAYDVQAFLSGNLRPATASSTLQSGLAVCDGYAGLFVDLAERIGVNAYKVGGHGKGFGYRAVTTRQASGRPPPFQGNHAWNCVLMDGEWRLIDCCWGAGALEGSTYTPRFTPAWFSSTPVEFARRHFPEDPGYQLIAEEDGGPVSWEQYILEPEGPVILKDFYELACNPYIVLPAEQHVQGGAWARFQVFKFCEHMSTEEKDNYVYFVNMPDGTRTPLRVNEEADGWGADVHVPSGGGELSLYYVTMCDGRDGKGLGVDGFLKANGRKAMSFGGLCRWTVL